MLVAAQVHAASQLDTRGGSPSRLQSAASRAPKAAARAEIPFVPVETPDDCATVTPDPADAVL